MGIGRMRVSLKPKPFLLSMTDWSGSEDATNELRVKTVKYFKSIEKVQDEVESKYGPAATHRLGLSRASAA